MRRVIELVYGVEGVVGVRVWQWPGSVAVGINVASAFTDDETLQRVREAVAPMRQADETWEFGLLGAA
jgi:hypothetical protein